MLAVSGDRTLRFQFYGLPAEGRISDERAFNLATTALLVTG
ncbi:hypothetical protein [Aquihabitans sp. G128]|nr:hypothetical protein [Aquihabitans sp. G128]